jgi:hypothetical protein
MPNTRPLSKRPFAFKANSWTNAVPPFRKANSLRADRSGKVASSGNARQIATQFARQRSVNRQSDRRRRDKSSGFALVRMNCHAVYRVRTNCFTVCLGVFCLWQKPGNAGWSSPVARQAHNLKAAGSNPAPATNKTSPQQAGFFVGNASRS